MSVRKDVRDQLPKGAAIFDKPSFDNSIIGTTTDGRLVYSYEKMVVELMSDTEMTFYESEKYINSNSIRMLSHVDRPPIIMHEKTWISKYYTRNKN